MPENGFSNDSFQFGDYISRTDRCVRGSPPDCANQCPFHLDVRALAEKIQRGRMDSVYSLYRDAVLFPEIVSRLCPAPCERSCVRCGLDEAVRLRALERAVVQYAKRKDPVRLNVPEKTGRVLIIGSGPCGLACALRMAQRKYQVTVCEQSDEIGGVLRTMPDASLYLDDIARQFTYEKWDLRLGTPVVSLDDWQADVVLIATGEGGETFSRSSDGDGVFLGGSLRGGGVIEAIVDGIRIADAMEEYLKIGRLAPESGAPVRHNTPDLTHVVPTPAIRPGDDGLYTLEQAKEEARRCLRCDCDRCVRQCALVSYYKRYPPKIAELVEGTVLPTDIRYHRVGVRLMAGCDQCGLCAQVCPEHIDVKSIVRDARRRMVRQGDQPRAFADFFLRDMEHANSPEVCVQLGDAPCSHLFFPGCQLGASDPRYVADCYEALRKKIPDMALLSSCCGAPADWAGYEELQREAAERIREVWEKLGKPVFVCACSSCRRTLAESLPEIETVSLYELDWDLPAAAAGETVFVFDPCSARQDERTMQRVRQLLTDSGYTLDPAAKSQNAACCGWGGQCAPANPGITGYVAAQQCKLSEHPYVTYCANCRDTFAQAGKPTRHILDILLGLGGEERPAPSLTQRRRNREALCERLTGRAPAVQDDALPLEISPELLRKMEARWILEDDVRAAVRRCEESGTYLLDPARDSRIGHFRQYLDTVWVEYRATESGFLLLDAYSHRTEIIER